MPAFPFIRSISLRSRKECHGTGSRHIECRGDVPPEEDRPTKVANMDHIGCGGFPEDYAGPDSRSGSMVGAMCNQRNFRARFITHNIDTD